MQTRSPTLGYYAQEFLPISLISIRNRKLSNQMKKKMLTITHTIQLCRKTLPFSYGTADFLMVLRAYWYCTHRFILIWSACIFRTNILFTLFLFMHKRCFYCCLVANAIDEIKWFDGENELSIGFCPHIRNCRIRWSYETLKVQRS